MSHSKCHTYSKAKKVVFTFPGDDCPRTPDFVVAGGGTTALPMALKLSDQGHRVLVIEIGKDFENETVVTRPLIAEPFLETGPVISNTFNSIADSRITSFTGSSDGPGAGFKLVPFITGRGIGGGGLHWLHTAVYPGDTILDGINPAFDLEPGIQPPVNTSTFSYRQAGGPAWSAAIMNGIIKNEIEGYRIGSATPSSVIPLPPNGFRDQIPTALETECLALRGINGPETVIATLPVNALATPTTGGQYIVQTALSAATSVVSGGAPSPVVKDYNCTLNCVSQGQNFFSAFPGFPVGFAPGAITRQNSATAFVYKNTTLTPEGDRVGINGRKLIILTDRAVIRTVEDTKKTAKYGKYTAAGVEFLYKNEMFYVHAKNVICSMGATFTPQFYMRSGIGPAAQLTSVGIPVKVDSPLIGTNLSNQYGGYIMFSALNGVEPNKYTLKGVGFVQQNNIARRLQIINTSFLNQTTQFGLFNSAAVQAIDPSRSYYSLVAFMVTPRSRGYINLTSADYGTQAIYHWNFYSDGSDPNLVASGINDLDKDSDIWVACEALDYNYAAFLSMKAQAPADALQLQYPPESLWLLNPGTSDAERQVRYRQMVPYLQLGGLAAAHEAGTCVMNNDPAKGACDGNLKLHGTTNCFAADGSIMPVQALGNTGFLEQAIGVNASKLIPTVALL